jgi:hypothetical protein
VKEAKKPDLNAPRFRLRVFNTLSKESYKHIRNEVPEAKSMSDQQIKAFLTDCNGCIYESVIDLRDGIELPEQLGTIFIGTCLPKVSKNVDFQKTLEYMKVIQHRNWESDQYIAKIFYTNYSSKYRFKYHELWGFTPIRQFKRTVAKTYPENWKRYIQVDHTLKISALYRKQKARDYIIKKTKENLQTYNDLDI